MERAFTDLDAVLGQVGALLIATRRPAWREGRKGWTT